MYIHYYLFFCFACTLYIHYYSYASTVCRFHGPNTFAIIFQNKWVCTFAAFVVCQFRENSYTRAPLVSQHRRHLFVTPWILWSSTVLEYYARQIATKKCKVRKGIWILFAIGKLPFIEEFFIPDWEYASIWRTSTVYLRLYLSLLLIKESLWMRAKIRTRGYLSDWQTFIPITT